MHTYPMNIKRSTACIKAVSYTHLAEKVIRSIRRDISDEAYLNIYLVTLSVEEDALQAIYNLDVYKRQSQYIVAR